MSQELEQFLSAANKAGYASGKEDRWQKEEDSSTTISFEQGDWRMHDNFFGGEPYAGREIVFFKEKPYWILLYWGQVDKTRDSDPIYAFLRNALSQPTEDLPPIRGPESFGTEELNYRNSLEGTIHQFSGSERIYKYGTVIYHAHYIGGLVDQRSE